MTDFGGESASDLATFWDEHIRSRVTHHSELSHLTPSAREKAVERIDEDRAAMRPAVQRADRTLISLRNSLVPISKLPPEVLLKIFASCTDASPPRQNGHGLRLDLGWINVTFVCRQWRHLALACSGRWRHIRISIGDKWTALMLERSKPAPIVFAVDYIETSRMSPERWYRLSDLVLQHVPRMEELNLRVNFHPAIYDFARRLVATPKPLLTGPHAQINGNLRPSSPTTLAPEFTGCETLRLRHLVLTNIYPPCTPDILRNLVVFRSTGLVLNGRGMTSSTPLSRRPFLKFLISECVYPVRHIAITALLSGYLAWSNSECKTKGQRLSVWSQV
ncbi:hypothetical protein BV25DRAFT_1514175 [Artomyces pyxidatus]|uniref:Uncharacterized protein n=1 Tax=Artomyces pyxidatus TaxID=48021 RepID=A0ACB8TCZ4_9AGAM|nr:hypothetical protein BV25DRAFT_1514175 [Artomyces pyxidatus]